MTSPIEVLSQLFVVESYWRNVMLELSDVRNALDATATKIEDFRGSL